MTAISPEDRVNFVGASEISTLLGINKFETREELVRSKAKITPRKDISAKPAVIWGHRLEDIVLQYVSTDFPQYNASVKCTEHWPHKEVPGFASSPDSIGTCEGEPSRGCIEAKTTKTSFWFPKDGTCPPGWQLQIQAQLSCSDGYLEPGEPRFEWGGLICLANTSEYRLWHIPRDDEVISQIHVEIGKFWEEVEAAKAELEPCPEPPF